MSAVARAICAMGALMSAVVVSGIGQGAAPVHIDAPKRQVSFAFDRKGVPVGHYRLTVFEGATGIYEGDEVPRATAYGAAVSQAAQPFKHQIAISHGTAERIFSTTVRLKRFDTDCASKLKNIADTGTKTLRYEGADGTGSCTFNYSENKDVQALTDIFEGIAETLDQGRRLDQLHRYDRLGLDAAMKYLADEVTAGHALEIGTIAPSLRSIAADTDVMARVRSRATALLSQVPTDVATP